MSREHIIIGDSQQMRCPEALYWNVGDVILCGKAWMEWYFVVVGRVSASVVTVQEIEKP
ncbi:MAG: hypothetical protein ACRDQZ_09105 [Mycobacteriales bacterium]